MLALQVPTSSPDWRQQHTISGPAHKFPFKVSARARSLIFLSDWCFGKKKKKSKKIGSLSQGQRGHLGTAMNFQQPSLSMKSLPVECPASLLREPGEVGHTWLRDASCAPPSVLLLSSEQQTVKWEEEVETRNFRWVCSELPPSNHPTRLWISEPNRQQMREPVMQRREGCAIAVSAAA